MPLLSVLIPTCQRPDFLRQALRSVLENGFTEPLEIILSDDAPDEAARAQSEKVIAEFSDAPIRYTVHPPPRDKPGNWQQAAELARGEFCFKLDDDDQVLPGFFARAIAFLRANPAAASVYSAFYVEEIATGQREEIQDETFFSRHHYLAPGAAYLRALLVNEGGYPRNHKSAALYRRESAERVGHYRWACEDFAFSAALALHGAVGYLPEPFFVWRRHAGSHVHNLIYTWKMSQRSLDGLEKVTFTGSETVTEAEWRRLIEACRAALPLYYLLASLRTASSAAEALALRREMEASWRRHLPHAGKIDLLFFFHAVGGKRLVLFLNHLYLKNRLVMQAAGLFFRRRKH